MVAARFVLGSRSPQRLELLKLLVPGERIVVVPPRSPDEADFAGLCDEAAIASQLSEIVAAKFRDVDAQLSADARRDAVAIVADTIIVATAADGIPVVLGQPPQPEWRPVVRQWFSEFYSGRTHQAWTGLRMWGEHGLLHEEIVKTAVTFRPIAPAEVEWYLSTEESPGKAGGYALQGVASLFVTRIDGSLSNVVGLPLEAVRRGLGTAES
jgi:septum formation protein